LAVCQRIETDKVAFAPGSPDVPDHADYDDATLVGPIAFKVEVEGVTAQFEQGSSYYISVTPA
jgi:hypothetical protein